MRDLVVSGRGGKREEVLWWQEDLVDWQEQGHDAGAGHKNKRETATQGKKSTNKQAGHTISSWPSSHGHDFQRLTELTIYFVSTLDSWVVNQPGTQTYRFSCTVKGIQARCPTPMQIHGS